MIAGVVSKRNARRAKVVAADGEAARREVVALHLDHPDVATDQLALFCWQPLEPGEVDDDGRTLVARDGPTRRCTRRAFAQVERGRRSSPGSSWSTDTS